MRPADTARLLALAVIWSASFVFVRVLAPVLGPVWVATSRVLVAGIALTGAFVMLRRHVDVAAHWREYLRRHGPLVITKEYERPSAMSWDDATYRGDAYGTYGWACDVVELEVDPDTWEVRPVEFTTVHEIGKAIHPMLAVGQIEGGSAQGLGYALLEDVVMRDGRMANAQLTNYIIPTTLDTPTMRVTTSVGPPAANGTITVIGLLG